MSTNPIPPSSSSPRPRLYARDMNSTDSGPSPNLRPRLYARDNVATATPSHVQSPVAGDTSEFFKMQAATCEEERKDYRDKYIHLQLQMEKMKAETDQLIAQLQSRLAEFRQEKEEWRQEKKEMQDQLSMKDWDLKQRDSDLVDKDNTIEDLHHRIQNWIYYGPHHQTSSLVETHDQSPAPADHILDPAEQVSTQTPDSEVVKGPQLQPEKLTDTELEPIRERGLQADPDAIVEDADPAILAAFKEMARRANLRHAHREVSEQDTTASEPQPEELPHTQPQPRQERGLQAAPEAIVENVDPAVSAAFIEMIRKGNSRQG